MFRCPFNHDCDRCQSHDVEKGCLVDPVPMGLVGQLVPYRDMTTGKINGFLMKSWVIQNQQLVKMKFFEQGADIVDMALGKKPVDYFQPKQKAQIKEIELDWN